MPSCRGRIEICKRVASGHPDRAAGRLGQACDHVEDRRLAAAGLAQDRQHLAAMDFEIEPSTAEIRRIAADFAEHL
jgi:hypothetical protein